VRMIVYMSEHHLLQRGVALNVLARDQAHTPREDMMTSILKIRKTSLKMGLYNLFYGTP
jgi:hypothetical protein